jgi:hypothetical protein
MIGVQKLQNRLVGPAPVVVRKYTDIHTGSIIILQMFRQLDFLVDCIRVMHESTDESDDNEYSKFHSREPSV